MPENIFSGTKLYPSLHFHGFQAKTKEFMCLIFLDVSFQKQLQKLPGESILLKFCQNVSNRQNLKVTKFEGATYSRFRVMVNNLMVWAK